ncbi:MAG: hydroxymethylglutaryl-CoA lyase [Candidatus Dormibacteraceae bacterium]
MITEESLRDGLQIESTGITLEQKLSLLHALSDSGLTRIVVGSFVSPKWTPQMADIDSLLERLEPRPGVTYLAVALNEKGRERRRRWSPPLTVDEIPETHLHMDPFFIKRNTNRTLEEQEQWWDLPVDAARAAGATEAAIGLSAGWGSNWSGPFPLERRLAELQRQFDRWQSAGIPVSTIRMFDAMGWNAPSVVAADLAAFRERFPAVTTFHLHMHNTRGLALTSAYAALTALGPEHTLMLDSSVGGFAGCPYCANGQAAGMMPTEDLVQMLETMGIPTGIDLYQLVEASALASEIVGRPLDGRVSKAGPMPDKEHLYDPQVPVIETYQEAQWFRLGPGAYRGRGRPWEGEPVWVDGEGAGRPPQ